MAAARRLGERGELVGPHQRHVAEHDHRHAVPRQRWQRGPHGVAGAARRILQREREPRPLQGLAHRLAAVAVHHADRARRKRLHGVDHVADDRLARERVQHLGQRGMHALALAGGEDDDVECGAHVAGL